MGTDPQVRLGLAARETGHLACTEQAYLPRMYLCIYLAKALLLLEEID